MDEAFQAYLRQIGEIPLLDTARERALGLTIQLGLKEQQKARPRKHVLAAARAARDELVCRNLRLVVSVAKRYTGKSLTPEELVQEGNIGLIRAAESFNPDIARFSTHATWWIRQAVSRALEDHDDMIRKPVYIHTAQHKIKRAEIQLGGSPTDDAIAAHAGLTLGEIALTRRAHMQVISLDKTVYVNKHGDERTLRDVIADEEAEDPYEAYELTDLQQTFARVLSQLGKREREIIMMRHGFPPYDHDHPLEEIGKKLDTQITRERVRQIEAKIMRLLRADAQVQRLAS